MDADGSNVAQLTDNSDAIDWEPSWARTLAPSPALTLAPSPQPTSAPSPAPIPALSTTHTAEAVNGRIAFGSGDGEIYAMDPDGSNVTRLTRNFNVDGFPDWSQDGRRIAFVSNRDGNSEIYAMDDDGSNVARLTNNSDSDQFPDWSPDGRRIAFQST